VRRLQSVFDFELAGTGELPELRQFGLVDNKRVDRFLATAFRKAKQKEIGKRSKPAKTVTKPGVS